MSDQERRVSTRNSSRNSRGSGASLGGRGYIRAGSRLRALLAIKPDPAYLIPGPIPQTALRHFDATGELLAFSLIRRAIQGDVRASELVLAYADGKPAVTNDQGEVVSEHLTLEQIRAQLLTIRSESPSPVPPSDSQVPDSESVPVSRDALRDAL